MGFHVKSRSGGSLEQWAWALGTDATEMVVHWMVLNGEPLRNERFQEVVSREGR